MIAWGCWIIPRVGEELRIGKGPAQRGTKAVFMAITKGKVGGSGERTWRKPYKDRVINVLWLLVASPCNSLAPSFQGKQF